MDYTSNIDYGKKYKLSVDMIMPNSIDIDGQNIAYGVTFCENLHDVFGGGMQINVDDTEAHDLIRKSFDEASSALLKAFRLLEEHEKQHETVI